jgi:hypothetical protein
MDNSKSARQYYCRLIKLKLNLKLLWPRSKPVFRGLLGPSVYSKQKNQLSEALIGVYFAGANHPFGFSIASDPPGSTLMSSIRLHPRLWIAMIPIHKARQLTFGVSFTACILPFKYQIYCFLSSNSSSIELTSSHYY